MDETDIISLFEKAISGNETAFRLLFEFYSKRLYHLAYYYLHSREAAEEVVLDVFTVVWKKKESLSHVKEPGRYLYTSVKNQALHYIRRGYVEDTAPLSLYEVELLPDTDTPEGELLDNEYRRLIQQAIDTLPPKCKEVFRLVLSDKLKNREIAELLDISEKTVNEHIAKAYKRIAEHVNKQYRSPKSFLFIFFLLPLVLVVKNFWLWGEN